MATLKLLIVGFCLLLVLTGCEEPTYPNTDGYKLTDITRLYLIIGQHDSGIGRLSYECDKLCLDRNHDLCFVQNFNCRMYDLINKTAC